MRRSHGAYAVVGISLLVGACNGEKRATGGNPSPADSASSGPVKQYADSGKSAGADARRDVLFLGTSLTAGYGLEPDSAFPQQIQHNIDDAKLPFRTVNAGVSGETSAGLLRRLDWVLQRPAAVIVVETGANDGLRGLSVAATKATIRQILDRIKKERPEAKLLLVQMEAPPNLGASYTAPFHAMFPELARETGAVLVPFLLNGVAGTDTLNQADGIHPNLVGERLVTSNVWRSLAPVLTP